MSSESPHIEALSSEPTHEDNFITLPNTEALEDDIITSAEHDFMITKPNDSNIDHSLSLGVMEQPLHRVQFQGSSDLHRGIHTNQSLREDPKWMHKRHKQVHP